MYYFLFGLGRYALLELPGRMKAIFCGNLDYDARQSDVERLFRRYGKIDRVDMKSVFVRGDDPLACPLESLNFANSETRAKVFTCVSHSGRRKVATADVSIEIMMISKPQLSYYLPTGFAFVYMEDERDAEDAIRRLDRTEFGRKGRRLRVEWTKQERDSRPAGSRRSSANMTPSKTLFVINFDPTHTRTRDLERHFDPYGKIVSTRIRRNFAFVQYELQEDATKALDATNMSKLMDRVISVEYAAQDDDERRNGYSPERRGRDRSPGRNYDHERSPSPYRRDRGSPDYSHGPNTNSRPERGNHTYDKAEGRENERYRSRSSPSRERSRS
ncbi:hypothetical protein DKX38_002935 [Salix brachista]|uniref:RRM domain-containing protein n=1 Tax=Salix brachista TaxID=2182728 RepID=A0A5N5NPC9_9ROSI|nr:hypothetical protein DKX38_002935 [Salix brachista]